MILQHDTVKRNKKEKQNRGHWLVCGILSLSRDSYMQMILAQLTTFQVICLGNLSFLSLQPQTPWIKMFCDFSCFQLGGRQVLKGMETIRIIEHDDLREVGLLILDRRKNVFGSQIISWDIIWYSQL